ncbi:Pro-kumamolisin, activation domain-containing protein [Pterulicium gracile]|uniref:Pro-kumamolisin, activation domain-containing protein n=1 Tax=Pterulicium gracile TaxID=1884261 RepID=A0A5C3QKH5_9AGAR|nr:Pro-kumamolisin, activation domain-containing protein [Pterula gracilis]
MRIQALTSFVLLAVLPSTVLSWHERRNAAPPGYVALAPAPSEQIITLKLKLRHGDMQGLKKRLDEASESRSEGYGTWLNREEVNAHAAPTPETLSTVSSWLASHGLSPTALSPAGDWIAVDMPVAKADELFSAAFSTFGQAATSETVVRTLGYAVPDALEGMLDVVHPTVSYVIPNLACSGQRPEKQHLAFHLRPHCPFCRFDLYGLPYELSTQPKEKNEIWLSGYNNNFVRRVYVRDYMAQTRPDVPELVNGTFEVVSLDGGINNQNPLETNNIAASKQMYAITSTATNVSATFMTIGTDLSPDPLDWLLSQAHYLLGLEKPPNVVVLGTEGREGAISSALAREICDAYAQLTARGVSLISHNWYGGVSARGMQLWNEPEANCQAGEKFDVTFPASCPYVTSVGGTSLIEAQGETVYHNGQPWMSNAGGFSSLFPRPEWQEDQVTGYLEKWGDVYEGRFDPSGRATPDVALVHTIGGLSANPPQGYSAPDGAAALFGGIIARLNDELVSAGKPTLGFLNPWIYKNQDAFNDITIGANPGCETAGFNATAGWDPVSGVGSPFYPRLREAAGL